MKGLICSRTKKILVYYNQAYVMIFIYVHLGYSSGGDTQLKELATVNTIGERFEIVIYRRNHTEMTIKMINT